MMTYEEKSEILNFGLRRDEWMIIAWTLNQSGKVGLAQDIEKLIESKENK